MSQFRETNLRPFFHNLCINSQKTEKHNKIILTNVIQRSTIYMKGVDNYDSFGKIK